ncbi:SPBc2 prophage-derived glycosyltransferase SunS [Marinomonas aquimarina]|uniref:SPBc2 prophage-derived glycosyltransferase SunS n=1 Tax=Marinomonas aquimarina TaxID=295068 RepID=A0A1A8T0K4_9GAMM|nr:glycosyltransferase family 2 protein [Marinomonas aquimarina]SBS25072.1 SPBc2 prophage-derived glycosyltransferase SunS [Marinomonas aquimarina]
MNSPAKRATVTAALIVKNEEKNLKTCLDSLADWVDEIVLLDSGSTDRTEDIARQYTSHFYTKENWEGFGKQRQAAQAYVNSDYVFWIDADEVVTAELKASILAALSTQASNTAYSVNRKSWVFGRFITHSGWYPDRVTRLYRVNEGGYSDDLVHEKVLLKEGVATQPLAGDMTHYTYDDLHHYLVKSASYAKLSADQKQKRGKTTSLSSASLHAFACFVKMYLIKRGFLDGKQGFLLAVLSAHSTFVKYADLWVRQQADRPDAH